MSKQGLQELELDKIELRGINRYKAVLMASQEARFINDQMRLGILKNEANKPTSIALRKLFEGRVVVAGESGLEE
jgi:DNA-directed RNA polymerase omega subunit